MSIGDYVRSVCGTARRILAVERAPNGIAFLNVRWPHHARKSGYAPVSDGLGPDIPDGRLLPRALGTILVGAQREKALDDAVRIRLCMALAGATCLDIVSGEDNLELAAELRRWPGVRVFMTFHRCPDDLEEIVRDAPDGIVDGVICVSRCQMDLVRRLARGGRCWFVPHGVDTDFFRPGDGRRDEKLVICVGVHRRDAATLGAAARRIRQARPDVSVRLIAPRKHLPEGVDLSGVQVCCDLSDQQLLECYQRAAVMLLPLVHSTANNSLLEAMACGLSTVTTAVGGVADYADESWAVLCPRGDAEAHAAAAIALLGDAQRRERMSQAARQWAMQFAWPAIRQSLVEILRRRVPPAAECRAAIPAVAAQGP